MGLRSTTKSGQETHTVKRLLIITGRPLGSIDGGDKLRIWNICNSLSADYQLDLLCVSDTETTYGDNYKIFENVIFIKVAWLERIWGLFLSLIKLRPLQIGYYRNKRAREFIVENQHKYDYLVCHLSRLAHLVENYENKTVLEATDALTLMYERSIRNLRFNFKSLIYIYEYFAMKKFEQTISRKFFRVVVVGSRDACFLNQCNNYKKKNDNVLVIENGSNIRVRNKVFDIKSNTLLFLGNLRSLQNQDAVFFFSTLILPEMQRKGYQFKLRVIGSVPPRFVNKCPSNIEFVGSKDDLVIATSDVFAGICPMRIGAGVQNKILDYFSLGIPALASKLSAQPFVDRKVSCISICETADDYIYALNNLRDKKSYFKTVDQGYRQLEKNYSWAENLQAYRELFKSGY